jgi:hypothetical protein
MVKVNANELLVLYNTLGCINLVATEKRNLKTVKVKLLDLLYLTIVRGANGDHLGAPSNLLVHLNELIFQIKPSI